MLKNFLARSFMTPEEEEPLANDPLFRLSPSMRMALQRTEELSFAGPRRNSPSSVKIGPREYIQDLHTSPLSCVMIHFL